VAYDEANRRRKSNSGHPREHVFHGRILARW
jgi:hypothetical protein